MYTPTDSIIVSQKLSFVNPLSKNKGSLYHSEGEALSFDQVLHNNAVEGKTLKDDATRDISFSSEEKDVNPLVPDSDQPSINPWASLVFQQKNLSSFPISVAQSELPMSRGTFQEFSGVADQEKSDILQTRKIDDLRQFEGDQGLLNPSITPNNAMDLVFNSDNPQNTHTISGPFWSLKSEGDNLHQLRLVNPEGLQRTSQSNIEQLNKTMGMKIGEGEVIRSMDSGRVNQSSLPSNYVASNPALAEAMSGDTLRLDQKVESVFNDNPVKSLSLNKRDTIYNNNSSLFPISQEKWNHLYKMSTNEHMDKMQWSENTYSDKIDPVTRNENIAPVLRDTLTNLSQSKSKDQKINELFDESSPILFESSAVSHSSKLNSTAIENTRGEVSQTLQSTFEKIYQTVEGSRFQFSKPIELKFNDQRLGKLQVKISLQPGEISLQWLGDSPWIEAVRGHERELEGAFSKLNLQLSRLDYISNSTLPGNVLGGGGDTFQNTPSFGNYMGDPSRREASSKERGSVKVGEDIKYTDVKNRKYNDAGIVRSSFFRPTVSSNLHGYRLGYLKGMESVPNYSSTIAFA